MNRLRIHMLGKLVALVTGVIFLNTSFIMVEINAIDLKAKNSFLYDCISKVVAGTGFDEKKDSSEKILKSGGSEEFITYESVQSIIVNRYLIINELYHVSSNQKYLSFDLKITTPPPKF